MANQEELQRALEYPWEKWTVFLHPSQRQVVERSFHGPARVSGSAGTGKTIVALHRAVHLARAHADARVLLTTFSTALADALRTRLTKLIASEPKIAERLEVGSMGDIGRRLYRAHFGRPELTTDDHVRSFATGGCRGRRRAQVQPALPLDGMESGCRRLAACELGGVSGRAAARPQDASLRAAASPCCGRSSRTCRTLSTSAGS